MFNMQPMWIFVLRLNIIIGALPDGPNKKFVFLVVVIGNVGN